MGEYVFQEKDKDGLGVYQSATGGKQFIYVKPSGYWNVSMALEATESE